MQRKHARYKDILYTHCNTGVHMRGVTTKYTFTLKAKHSDLSWERQAFVFHLPLLNFSMLLFCLRGLLAYTVV